MLKVERRFRPVESASSNQGVLDENAMKETLRKKGIRCKWNRRSAHQVEVNDFENLQTFFSPKKRARRTETATNPRMVTRKSAKKWSNGSRSQKENETSAVKPQATSHVLKQVREKEQ